MNRSGLTMIELVLIIMVIAILLVLLTPAVTPSHEARRRVSCGNNLKQMGIIFKMYADESSDSRYPPVQGDDLLGASGNCPGCRGVHDGADLAPELGILIPEYMNHPWILRCPNSDGGAGTAEEILGQVEDDGSGTCPPQCQVLVTRAGRDYVYLGWAVDKLSDSDPLVDSNDLGLGPGRMLNGQLSAILAFLQRDGIVGDSDNATDQRLDEDIDVAAISGVGSLLNTLGVGNGAGSQIHRLGKGLARILMEGDRNPGSEALRESQLPVMWDVIELDDTPLGFSSHHLPGGALVLYMDGHVGYKRYPTEGPVNRKSVLTLGAFGNVGAG